MTAATAVTAVERAQVEKAIRALTVHGRGTPTHPDLTPETPPVWDEGVRLPDPVPPPRDAPADWRQVPMPPAVARLPKDRRGYPVFVNVTPPGGVPEDGRVDFRLLNLAAHIRCINERLCGICGHRLHRDLYFIGGPMCVQNRAFGDTPMHEACARYALAVCPFLTNPQHEYNQKALEGHHLDPNVIRTKPGRVVLYVTADCAPIRAQGGKPILIVAPAKRVEWWTPDGKYVCTTRPTRYAQ